MQPVAIEYFNDAWQKDPNGLNWRAVHTVESGGASAVVARAFVRWASAWGTSSYKIVALTKTGAPIGEPDYRNDYWELPATARFFTAEGRRQRGDTMISVSLLQLAK